MIAAGVPLCTFFIIPRGPSTKEQGVFSLIGPARASFREFSTTSPLNRRKKRTQIAKPTLVSSSSEELALVKWTAPSPQLALVKWTSP